MAKAVHKQAKTAIKGENGTWTYRYVRCRAEDKVPMQLKSWQRAEIVIAPPALAKLTSSLGSPHRVEVEAKLWSEQYGNRAPLPDLNSLLQRRLLSRDAAHVLRRIDTDKLCMRRRSGSKGVNGSAAAAPHINNEAVVAEQTDRGKRPL